MDAGKIEQQQIPEEIVISLSKDEEKTKLMGTGSNSLERSVVPRFPLESELFPEAKEPAKPGVKGEQVLTCPFLEIAFYRQYFDISTDLAVQRIIKALWPFRTEKFIDTEHNPDLYVPLWNALTLVITMALLGNAATALQNSSGDFGSTNNNMTKVVTCFSVLTTYLLVNSAVAYAALRFKGATISLATVLSIYGYSLVVFAPTSLLYLLPYPYFRFIVLLYAGSVGMYFLWRNLEALCDKYLKELERYVQVYTVLAQLLLLYMLCFHVYS